MIEVVCLIIVMGGIGLSLIVAASQTRHKRREAKMAILRRSVRPWKVHKEVVVVRPVEMSKSKEMALRETMSPQSQYIPLEWPRVLRVTITNQSNLVLIGEAKIEEEQKINELVNTGTSRCEFLNAHEVV